MKDFSIGQILSDGWKTFEKNWVVFVIATLLVNVPAIIVFAISFGLSKDAYLARSLLSFLNNFITIIFVFGLIKMALTATSGKKVELGTLFDGLKNFKLMLMFFLCAILFGFMLIFGLIFFVIPGVIVAVRFWPSLYFVVDQGKNPFEALSLAWNATRGMFGKLFLAGLVLMLINIAGFLLLVVGSLITGPVVLLSIATLYRRISA